MNGVYLPLAIAVIGIVASIIGFTFVRTKEGGNPQAALNTGTFLAAGLMIVATFGSIWWFPAFSTSGMSTSGATFGCAPGTGDNAG